MAGREVKVAIIGDASRLKSALNEASAKSGEFGDKFGKSTALIAGGAAVMGAAVLKFAKDAVGAFQDTGEETRKLQIITGASAQSMSGLIAAGEELGVGYDSLVKSLGIFSKKIASSKDTMADFGIAARDTQGNMLPMDTLLGETADKFAAMPDGIEKTALSMKLFGKSGKDMIPLLDEGSAGLQKLKDKAAALGLVMSQQDVDAAHKLTIANRELNEAFKGLEVRVGSKIVPVLATLAQGAVKAEEGLNAVFSPKTGAEVVSAKTAAMSMNMQELGDALGKNRNDWQAWEQYIKHAGLSWSNVSDSLTKPGQFDAVQKDLGMMRASAIALADAHHITEDAALKWIQQEGKAGITFGTVDDALKAYNDTNGKAATAADMSAEAIKAEDDALKEQTSTLRAQFDPMFGYIDSQQKLNDANWAAATALKEHGKGSAEYKKAAEDAAKASLDFKVAQDTLISKIKENPAALADATKSAEDWVAQGLITRDTANQMEQAFRKAAYEANAPINLTVNTTQAYQAITDFFKWTHANKVDVPMDLTVGPKMKAFAGGGQVSDGWFMVGEQGPEMMRKSGDRVDVFNQTQMPQASGGHTFNFPNYVGDKSDLVRAVREAVRSVS